MISDINIIIGYKGSENVWARKLIIFIVYQFHVCILSIEAFFIIREVCPYVRNGYFFLVISHVRIVLHPIKLNIVIPLMYNKKDMALI